MNHGWYPPRQHNSTLVSIIIMREFLQRLLSSQSSPSRAIPAIRFPGRVLYAVNHCYPFSSNGYAVRTHGIAVGLQRAGCDLIVAPGRGMRSDHPALFDSACVSHVIDGVRYLHSAVPSEATYLTSAYIDECVLSQRELIRVFKPSIVMAASNW